MSRSSSRRAVGRPTGRKFWLQNALVGLAVSALGLGVVGAVMTTGHAQHTTDRPNVTVQESTEPNVDQPSAFDRRDEKDDSSRDSNRPALKGQLHEQAERRSEALAKSSDKASQQAQKAAESTRAKSLKAAQKAAAENGERLAAAAKAAEKDQQDQQNATTEDQPGSDQGATGQSDTGQGDTGQGADQPAAGDSGTGQASLPLASYNVAARFGQVGAWSRYHTGFDFSAPVGTPIRAADSGTVTNAGSGSASGWAGTYVTIKHADGSSSLYAHMSSVSVSVGQQVSGGAQIGNVGMTGRTFGPHCHFEIYPAGVTPGDVYRAVNPETWLQARGLTP